MNSFLPKLIIFLASSCIFLIFFSPVYAKIEVNNVPAKVEINKEFELDVFLSNLSDPMHYLSIAIHKKSGDPYFGQTKNGDNWIDADDANCKSFPRATVIEGSWSGKLKGKVSYGQKDFDNSLGNYILKVFKYTDSCSKSSSGDLAVEIVDPNPPTPTNKPTPTDLPTIKPTVRPTNAPISTISQKSQNTPTVYFSPSATQKPTSTVSVYDSNGYMPLISDTGTASGEVLGKEFPSNTTTDSSLISSAKKEGSFPLLLILLGSGVGCIIGAVILSLRKIKK